MPKRNQPFVMLAAGAMLAGGTFAHAVSVTGFSQTGAGPWNYNDTANWVGGVVNGLWDVTDTLTAAQTVTFSADTTLTTGLTFNYDGGYNVGLRSDALGDRTLTLGGDIIVNTVSTTRIITLGSVGAGSGLNIDLGGTTRTFTVGSGRSLGFVNVISNGGIIANGGTLNFSGANTYSGQTIVNVGNFSLNGASGSAVNSDFIVDTTSPTSTPTLTFDSSTNGVAGTTRVKSLTLNGVGSNNGVALNVKGNATVNSVDTITNALTATGGFSTVTLTPNAARNTRLAADSFVRNDRSLTLFRGTNLGVNAISSTAANSANIVFASAPALTGTGSAGTTIGILKGAFGDTTTGGAGSGLVTYDATYGVRLLNNATEYTATILNAQSQLDNVRYVNTSGSGVFTTNLGAGTTTVNSLSFNVSGTSMNGGVTVSGDVGSVLKLYSGVIFAKQTVTTPSASDAMTVSVPVLDLNGGEGTILAFTTGVSNGNTAAPLYISSSITNDGGKGVTFGGTGETVLTGSVAHTYTGVTTLNSGILRLNRTGGNNGIAGDLVLNGGTLLKNSNSIPDTATLTLNGGAFWFDSTTSSGNNGNSETINNFIMTGGSLNHHGKDNAFTINGNATITAGDLRMNQGGDVTVSGTTLLNGGRILGNESSSTSTYNAVFTLNKLEIVNPAAGAYTAIVINSHATNKGNKFVLNGDVTFTGNGTNANTVLVDSSDIALANQGFIALNGTRTFTVGDGLATDDLTIVPAMVDGTSAGGLIKTGSGTLALSGSNTYTGATTVGNGILKLASGGSLATSGVTVDSGAAFINNGAYSGGVTANGTLSGSGTLTGAISGAGLVSPGNSPGILTAGQVDPTGNLGFAFEFTGTGSPAYGSATASVNDVLRITNATTPFTAALASTNTIGVYLNVTALTGSDTFNGAFYTDAGSDFLSSITNGTYDYYVKGDGNGSVSFNGVNYYTLAQYNTLNSSAFSFSVSTVAESADFGGGAVNGYVTQFAVPEPAMLALLGVGGLAFLRRRRNG